MDEKFRIVFQGGLREGLDPALVRQQAAIRLRASPAQIERIFSGSRVVLKQHLEAAQGLAYQAELEKLGMIIAVEAMSPAASAAVLNPPSPPPAEKPAEVCQFQRTHINLARAEALLNGTSLPPPAPAAKASVQVATNAAPDEAWMHESGFVRLERAQKKLADAAAQFSQPPASPAHLARQTLPDAEPTVLIIVPPPTAQPPQVFSSVFQCSHCGTEHQVESRLELNIVARPTHERMAS